MDFNGNMSQEYQQRPGYSKTLDPDMAFSGSMDQDNAMALSGSADHSDKYGAWQQLSPQIAI